MMYPIRVAIIGDGSPKIQSKEAYRELAAMYAKLLNGQIETGAVRRFNAQVVFSVDEALKDLLSTAGSRSVLIFISNYFMREAKTLAA